jgi:hypothetical protein
MAGILETIITVVVGTINGVTGTVSNGIASVEDFIYVRFSGMPFIVLGARQVGKTTLIEWLKRNMDDIEGYKTNPTGAGGDSVPEFTAKVGETHFKLKATRDVGGEYAMWETDWVELFREAKPRGIIFMLDHTDVHLQKDALNFVLQMIEDEPNIAKGLRAFYVLVNKQDIWGEYMQLDEILGHYKNEQKRLRAQAERLGYQYAITYGSLYTGKGVKAMMKSFFNTLRPKPRDIKHVD